MEKSTLKSPAREGGNSSFGRAPPAAKALLLPLLGLAHLGQEEIESTVGLAHFIISFVDYQERSGPQKWVISFVNPSLL